MLRTWTDYVHGQITTTWTDYVHGQITYMDRLHTWTDYVHGQITYMDRFSTMTLEIGIVYLGHVSTQ